MDDFLFFFGRPTIEELRLTLGTWSHPLQCGGGGHFLHPSHSSQYPFLRCVGSLHSTELAFTLTFDILLSVLNGVCLGLTSVFGCETYEGGQKNAKKFSLSSSWWCVGHEVCGKRLFSMKDNFWNNEPK
jgi:hypothetical protein